MAQQWKFLFFVLAWASLILGGLCLAHEDKIHLFNKVLQRQPKADEFICTADGFYPYDDSCGPQYYSCYKNVSSVENCGVGLAFDPETKRCVPETEASCYGSTRGTTTPSSVTGTTSSQTGTGTSTTKGPTTTNPSGFTCPGEGNYPITPQSCLPDYYICVSGTAYPTRCPGGDIVFDPVVGRCTAYDTASCKNSFQCPVPDGNAPIFPGACSKNYYLCIANTPYYQTCPGDSTIFDPQISNCKLLTDSSCAATWY